MITPSSASYVVVTAGALLALDEETGGAEEKTIDEALEDGALDDAGVELITLDAALDAGLDSELECALPVAL